jgi:hypothetical protein
MKLIDYDKYKKKWNPRSVVVLLVMEALAGTMKKYGAVLVLLLALSCLAGAQKPKIDKLLPPSESHGMTISGYGCDPELLNELPGSSKSLFNLIVWAEYGKKHKRYWGKTYGTYQITAKRSVNSSGEEVATGAPIAPNQVESYDFGPINKACDEWRLQVKSTLKIEPNEGEKPKQ